MSETTIPLTGDEQLTLKKAAFGAIQLLSVANPGVLGYSATKENMAGARVLSGAVGTVGHVLNNKDKIKITGTPADIAGEVLPALTATVKTLEAKVPDQVDEFRRLVTNSVEQAARSTGHGQISPAQAEMISKITAALTAD